MIAKLYNKSLEKLKKSGIKNYINETRWIFESEGILYKDILTYPKKKINLLKTIKILRKINKRAKKYPLQYILGYEEFMGIKFIVNPNVLIPRPETEVLVREAIKIIPPNSKIIDLGSGSGIIGILLKYYRKDLNVTMSDISKKSLKVAKKNIKLILKEENAIKTLHSDIFSKINDKFDAIISNPPYIVKEEIYYTDPEIFFEPKISLFCKYKEEFYEKILLQGIRILNKDGVVIFEIGIGTDKSIEELFKKSEIISKKYQIQKIIKDFNGINRVCVIKSIS